MITLYKNSLDYQEIIMPMKMKSLKVWFHSDYWWKTLFYTKQQNSDVKWMKCQKILKKKHFPPLIVLHQNFSANITWWSLLARESWVTWDRRRKKDVIFFYECNIMAGYESDSIIMNLVNLIAFIIKHNIKDFVTLYKNIFFNKHCPCGLIHVNIHQWLG